MGQQEVGCIITLYFLGFLYHFMVHLESPFLQILGGKYFSKATIF